MAKQLETVTAQWLLEQSFKEPEWVVEDLIPSGLHLLVGSPKIGKSWMILDLGMAICTGSPFWGFATHQSDVLYLCLEDTYNRIQQRLWILTDEANNHFHFSLTADKISEGLVLELADFIERNPETRLIAIDTFQVVRSPSRESAYAADYGDMTALKTFADEHNIAVLVVHHTRKMGDADVFNTVSGTTGITGSADSTFVLTKSSRSDSNATLSVAGRDIAFQELKLRFHDCRWELVEKTSDEELEEREVPDAILRVLDFMAATPGDWQGTATALQNEAGITDITVAVLGKYLAQHRDFMAMRGVLFDRVHRREGTLVTLAHSRPCEGSDSSEGK